MSASPSDAKCVGLIGLGLLGTAIAERLLKAGLAVTGFDTVPERASTLVHLGGTMVQSPTAVALSASRIVLALPNSADVAKVLWDDDGLMQARVRPTHVIDTGTGDPERMVAMAGRLAADETELIDATIVGSSDLVRRGASLIVIGGHDPAVLSCTDLFSAIAKRWFHMGGPGAGSRARLGLNLVLGLNRLALAEGIAFAEKLGMDPASFVELLRLSPAYSAVMDTKASKMLSRDYAPQARLGQYLKEVHLILGIAAKAQQGLPLTELQSWILAEAVEAGEGELDTSVVIESVRRQRPAPERSTP